MSWLITGREAGPADPFIGSVSLLLHGDGTNGSTTITDSSPTPKTVTAVGNAQISTAQSKFGGASIAFDGAGDTLTISNAASVLSGTESFTAETWVWTNNTTNQVIFTNYLSSLVGVSLYVVSNSIRFYYRGNVNIDTATALPVNQWNHIAVSRDGLSTKVFLGGSQIGSTLSDNYSLSGASTITVGALEGGAFLNGYIDDLRITKGVARYTANFTPPDAPFPDAQY